MSESAKEKRSRVRSTLRLLIIVALFSIFLVLFQSFLIFPGASISVFSEKGSSPQTLPVGVESVFVRTEDSEELEVWRLEADGSDYVGVFFHGNGADVRNFLPYQKYFQSLGMVSYGFDYRGFGRSSGWPTESGLYLDAKAVVDYVLKREKIHNSKLILVGVSIGSGPASKAAVDYDPSTLVLYSPFISITEIVNSHPLFKYLKAFLLFEFPVKENVSKLKSTCLIVAHGKKDRTIPFRHGKEVSGNYSGNSYTSFIESGEAGHNDILYKTTKYITQSLKTCGVRITRQKT